MWILIEDKSLRGKILDEISKRTGKEEVAVKFFCMIFFGAIGVFVFLPELVRVFLGKSEFGDFLSALLIICLFFGGFFGLIFLFAKSAKKQNLNLWSNAPIYYAKGVLLEKHVKRRKNKYDRIWYDVRVGNTMYECKELLSNDYKRHRGRPCVIIASGTECIDVIDRYHSGHYVITIDDILVDEFDSL